MNSRRDSKAGRGSRLLTRLFTGWMLALMLVAVLPATAAQKEKDQRLKWWREAHFGLFIHWGLYAVPAGEWNGYEVPGIGEWIMNRAKIPVSEYEQLAKKFNPVKFNAEEWVRIAKRAGMKYITITSKHHDGFAMYHSRVSPYNIYDATPFHRDPMKELAEACQKEGIKLCFYYSHAQDWHNPDAAGNNWDFPDQSKKDFARYLRTKAIPQVKELLSNYGPIGLVWFDTPRTITAAQSRELAELVHNLQPDCIVSGRVGHDQGDYRSLGDNQIPGGVLQEPWEVPATMNDTWGFKVNDHNWKSARTLLRQLVDITSKNGNFLLNVGPTAEGVIPQASVDRLREMGEWMDVNGESIYGAGPSPFPTNFEWGTLTTKPGKVYVHIYHWPKGEFVLYGLKNKVSRAYLLADKSKMLKVSQRHDRKLDNYELRVSVPPRAPDPRVSVLVLEIDGNAQAETGILQQPDGTIKLEAFRAEVHSERSSPRLRFDPRGIAAGWRDAGEWLSWQAKILRPGEYDVSLYSTTAKYAYRPSYGWDGGHRVRFQIGDSTTSGVVDDDGQFIDLKNPYWIDVRSKIGRVKVAAPGVHRVELRAEEIRARRYGLTLHRVKLTPVK